LLERELERQLDRSDDDQGVERVPPRQRCHAVNVLQPPLARLLPR
jgi:hypothetical protein